MSENGKMRIPLEGVIQGPPTAVTIEVRLGLLLPRQVMERLTHATTVGVSAVDLLAKTKLAKGKRQAQQLISAGESPRNKKLDPAEHAAYTVIASVILNLDEVMTKE